jgi:hypothetical protein
MPGFIGFAGQTRNGAGYNRLIVSHGESQMKLIILFVVVVGAILVWWLRSVKPKRRI